MSWTESHATPEHFATVSDKSGAARHRHATHALYQSLIANRKWGLKDMIRYLIVFAAAATATVSMMSADAQPTPVQPRVITQTKDGQPIMLGRMAVTATALPETGK